MNDYVYDFMSELLTIPITRMSEELYWDQIFVNYSLNRNEKLGYLNLAIFLTFFHCQMIWNLGKTDWKANTRLSNFFKLLFVWFYVGLLTIPIAWMRKALHWDITFVKHVLTCNLKLPSVYWSITLKHFVVVKWNKNIEKVKRAAMLGQALVFVFTMFMILCLGIWQLLSLECRKHCTEILVLLKTF